MAEPSKVTEFSKESTSASNPAPGSSTKFPGDFVLYPDSVSTDHNSLVQQDPHTLEMELQAVISQKNQLMVVKEAQEALIKASQNTIESQNNQMICMRILTIEERKLWKTGFRDSNMETAPDWHHRGRVLAPQHQPETTVQEGGLQGPTRGMGAAENTPRQSRTDKGPVWFPRLDQIPTRVFNDDYSRNGGNVLGASKSSGQTNENNKRTASGAGISDLAAAGSSRRGATVPGHLISKNYDSIPLKTQGLVTDEARRLFTSQAGNATVLEKSSPLESPRGSKYASPKSPPFSRSRLPLPGEVDPTLRDAGHTPPARGQLPLTSLDGCTSHGDSHSTPKGGAEKTPLETPTTLQEPIRQPRNPPVTIDDESPVVDAPLSGPLGLTNSPDNERNQVILGEIDEKLSKAKLTEIAGNIGSPVPSIPSGDPSKASQSNVDPELKNVDGSVCETPEPEPPLVLKKNLNFGTAFGKGKEVDYGKGFAKRDP